MAQPFSSSGSIAELPTRQFHNRFARKRVCDTDTKQIARELHVGAGSSLITSASRQFSASVILIVSMAPATSGIRGDPARLFARDQLGGPCL
jgi:hypothetical protein